MVLETLFIYYSDDGHLEALGSLLKQFVSIVLFGAQLKKCLDAGTVGQPGCIHLEAISEDRSHVTARVIITL